VGDTRGTSCENEKKKLKPPHKRKRKRGGGERIVVRQGRSWSAVAEGRRGGKTE